MSAAAPPLLEPSQFPRRILLCVTGLSPQVVTETLYALAVDTTPPFYPTEVHLITTQSGKELARTALLHPNTGHFHALLADYPQLGTPRFDEAQIHVIQDESGRELPDICTPEENAAAADTIIRLMAQMTQDDSAALHVSIAGGRKTMGFYLGYAFSLFARPQDRLSHVLVFPSPFEGHPEFFYPPPRPRQLVTRDNRTLDTAEAQVQLAQIPVVRLREGLPEALLKGTMSFNATVRAAEAQLQPPRLFIDLPRQRLLCGETTVKLPPALIAWFAWWADRLLNNDPLQHWRSADAQRYLELYRRVVGVHSDAFEKTARRLAHGMEKAFFEENNAKLERALRDQLGPAAQPYLLVRVGRRPHTRRGLNLPPQAVTLIE